MRALVVTLAIVVPTLAVLLASPEARSWVRGTGSIRQTISNAKVGLVFLVAQLLLRGALVGAFAAVSSLVPWTWQLGAATWVVAFVALDLLYYVQHRLEHAVPFLWAIHSVHHQSRDYNLSVSLRVGALASLSTFVFHAPLALAGVSVELYAAVVAVHAGLLFALHARTKLILGPGRFFNAPLFHRVHHGAEAEYVDKNFGGVFLVFDRLLGTFAPYVREPTFGVAGERAPEGPLSANVAPWRTLLAAAGHEPTAWGKVKRLFRRAE